MKTIKFLVTILLLVSLFGTVSVVAVNNDLTRQKDYELKLEGLGLEPIEKARPAFSNSIMWIMFNYQSQTGEMYKMGHPLDREEYYGIPFPGIILSDIYDIIINGKKVKFTWRDTWNEYKPYIDEQIYVKYELIDSFVNESGTELIAFAMKDGKRFVFQSHLKPTANKEVILYESMDPLLIDFIKPVPTIEEVEAMEW